MPQSPLLHGQKTHTPLDLITERLYFIWPLTNQQIEWLNTPVPYGTTYPFWINYWSFTHAGWGAIWALLGVILGKPDIFSMTNLLIFHTLFEVWELWAGGYIGSSRHAWHRKLDLAEFVDVIMDTLFSVVGYFVAIMVIRLVSNISSKKIKTPAPHAP